MKKIDLIFVVRRLIGLGVFSGVVSLGFVNANAQETKLSVIDSTGKEIVVGDKFSEVKDDLNYNVVIISNDITEAETVEFKDSAVLRIQSDKKGTVRKITMDEKVTDDAGSFFKQSSSRGDLSLYLNNINLFGGKGSCVVYEGKKCGGFGGAITTRNNLRIIGTSIFEANKVSRDGGAIYLEAGDLIVCGKNIFKANEAEVGGAIFADASSDPEVLMTAAEVDGATYTGGNVVLMGENTFILNKTRAAVGGGGAIYAYQDIRISGINRFEKNEAEDFGGALSTLAGKIYISGMNTFKSNKAESAGAIEARSGIVFYGDKSKAVFIGNKDISGFMNGVEILKPSDITIDCGNVIFQDAGFYLLDGGIYTDNYQRFGDYTYYYLSGNLLIGMAMEGKSAGGTKVTFEKGAINYIAGLTTISGIGTHVRFNNIENELNCGVILDDKATLTVGGKLTVGKDTYPDYNGLSDLVGWVRLNGLVEFVYDESFGLIDLTLIKKAFISSNIRLVNVQGEELSIFERLKAIFKHDGEIVIIKGSGDVLKSFEDVTQKGVKIKYKDGNIVVCLDASYWIIWCVTGLCGILLILIMLRKCKILRMKK